MRSNRPGVVVLLFATCVVVAWLSRSPAAQAPAACPSESSLFHPCALARAASYRPVRTPDGKPNLQGFWRGPASGTENIEEHPKTDDDDGDLHSEPRAGAEVVANQQAERAQRQRIAIPVGDFGHRCIGIVQAVKGRLVDQRGAAEEQAVQRIGVNHTQKKDARQADYQPHLAAVRPRVADIFQRSRSSQVLGCTVTV